jgi:hypothetical protein
MNRHLAAFAATAATAALAGTALAIPAAASASAQAPIRTFTGQGSVALTGVGVDKGWYHDYSQAWKVTLSPGFSAVTTFHASYIDDNKHVILSGRDDFFGHTQYFEENNGAWKRTTLTNGELRTTAAAESPYSMQAKFDTLSGVHKVGDGEYQVTGSDAKVGSFLDSAFGLPASAVSGNKIASVTIDLWKGPAGRPLKVAVSGASPTVHLYAQETFGNFNKPLTLHAPS